VQQFQGKRVIVTGAGRGIGKRLAIGFARAGARVGLLARSRPELDLARLEIEHGGGEATALVADVRDYDALYAAAANFGPADVLVCAAAGQGTVGPLYAADPAAWADVISTNLIGVMHSLRAVLPSMVERRSGKVIALTCRGSGHARPNFTAYAASKTALVRLVETVADEVLEHNVQVNCMSPGETYTNMTDEVLAAGDAAGWREIEDAERLRINGGTAPDKQIALALFLASERSNHLSGRFLHVNDDWKRLEQEQTNPELFKLRRVQRV
jgi:3-oxoacyl-[acyl-carrier protein] reductase